MKLYSKKLSILGIVLLIIFILGGCNQNFGSLNLKLKNAKTFHKTKKFLVQENSKSIQMKLIKKYVNQFCYAIKTQNSQKLKQIANRDGIVLIRTFSSGNGTRGAEIDETINPSKMPCNLVFSIIKGEEPISFKDEFETDNKDFSKMKLINISKYYNWNNELSTDIINNFGEIVGNKDPGEDTNLYIFKDGSFSIAQFAGSGLQYSNWAVFSKKGGKYQLEILAIIY